MKVSDISHPAQLQQVEEKESKSPAAKERTAASSRKGGDVIELSTALDQQSTVQQGQLRAQQIASIKSQVKAGTYQVDAWLVAQKMLSGDSGI
jgi:negative regulator of flagellin synthesis FlgM